MLKLSRICGQWIQLTDRQTGTVIRVRAFKVQNDDRKIQFDIDAPDSIEIKRYPKPSAEPNRA